MQIEHDYTPFSLVVVVVVAFLCISIQRHCIKNDYNMDLLT